MNAPTIAPDLDGRESEQSSTLAAGTKEVAASAGRSRVLMFSYPFPPAASGGVFRILRFTKYLPENGWDPIVITPRETSVIPISVDESLNRLIPVGLRVERTTVFRPFVATKSAFKSIFTRFRGGNGQTDAHSTSAGSTSATADLSGESRLRRCVGVIERFLATPDRHIGWFLPAVARGLSIARRERAQVLYSTGPPHSTHMIPIALKKLTGIPAVLDFRDPWAANEWGNHLQRSTPGGMTGRFERWCVRAADHVILNTPALKAAFISAYPEESPEKFSAIPNGFSPDLVHEVEALVRRHQADPASPTIRLCHAGSAYGKRDLRPLAEAVKIVAASGRRIEMEQVGAVSPDMKLPEFVERDDSNAVVRLVGEVSHQVALERMARAQILVLIQPDNTLQIPGKFYEMLPFRKPILALTGKGATGDVVGKFGVGEVVDPNDPNEIAAAIGRLADGLAADEMDAAFDAALRRFDGRMLTQELSRVIDAVAR